MLFINNVYYLDMIQEHHKKILDQDIFSASFIKEVEDSPNQSQQSDNKGGFAGLQAQIKKQALNLAVEQQPPPHSARGAHSFVFDQDGDDTPPVMTT